MGFEDLNPSNRLTNNEKDQNLGQFFDRKVTNWKLYEDRRLADCALPMII
jgi:hypothetical protein